MSDNSSNFSFEEATTSSRQSWLTQATTIETTIATAAVTARAAALRGGVGRQASRGRSGRFTAEVYGRRSIRLDRSARLSIRTRSARRAAHRTSAKVRSGRSRDRWLWRPAPVERNERERYIGAHEEATRTSRAEA